MRTTGLLLAAGGGRRMGRPKALVDGWLVRAVESLAACDNLVVVLGAAAEEAAPLLAPYDVTVVVHAGWEEGMGTSLHAGLAAVAHGAADRCLVTLVDLPDVGAEVVDRMLVSTAPLARATYGGRPGHPVVMGREHWAGVLESLTGDEGARVYLDAHQVELVECGDLASGRDIDSLNEPS